MGFFERRRQQKLEALWARANEALSSEDYAKALGVLDQIVGADGENIDAFLLKFDALRKLKRHDEAKTLLSNLSQWSTAEARDRVALEQARLALEDRLWMQAWRILPKTPVPQQPWLWLEAALRCCYELQDAGEFQRNVKQYWNEADAAKADGPVARRAVSAIHTLLGSFLEDEGTPGPETTAKIEQHYRKALELWPGNAEARSCLEDILQGQNGDEGEREGAIDGDVVIHTSIEFGAVVDDTEFEKDDDSAGAASGRDLKVPSPTQAPKAGPRSGDPDDALKAASARTTGGIGSFEGGLRLRPVRLQPSEQADWIEAVASAARYRGLPDYAFRIRVELAKHIASRGDASRAQTILLSFDGSSPTGPDLVAFAAQLEGSAPDLIPDAEATSASRVEARGDGAAEKKADGIVDEKAALILFDLLTGQLDAAQTLLAEARSSLGSPGNEGGDASDYDFLEGQLHLMCGRHAEAVPALNRAREADRWKPEVYPRLVLAHLFARDAEGLEWAFGQWEKWLEAGLDTESAEELARWEAPLDGYLELGDALGRLASFRLQRWKWSLMKNGFGNSRGFQLLYDADARLRVAQDRPPELVREILFRLTGGMDLELAGYLSE